MIHDNFDLRPPMPHPHLPPPQPQYRGGVPQAHAPDFSQGHTLDSMNSQFRKLSMNPTMLSQAPHDKMQQRWVSRDSTPFTDEEDSYDEDEDEEQYQGWTLFLAKSPVPGQEQSRPHYTRSQMNLSQGELQNLVKKQKRSYAAKMYNGLGAIKREEVDNLIEALKRKHPRSSWTVVYIQLSTKEVVRRGFVRTYVTTAINLVLEKTMKPSASFSTRSSRKGSLRVKRVSFDDARDDMRGPSFAESPFRGHAPPAQHPLPVSRENIPPIQHPQPRVNHAPPVLQHPASNMHANPRPPPQHPEPPIQHRQVPHPQHPHPQHPHSMPQQHQNPHTQPQHLPRQPQHPQSPPDLQGHPQAHSLPPPSSHPHPAQTPLRQYPPAQPQQHPHAPPQQYNPHAPPHTHPQHHPQNLPSQHPQIRPPPHPQVQPQPLPQQQPHGGPSNHDGFLPVQHHRGPPGVQVINGPPPQTQAPPPQSKPIHQVPQIVHLGDKSPFKDSHSLDHWSDDESSGDDGPDIFDRADRLSETDRSSFGDEFERISKYTNSRGSSKDRSIELPYRTHRRPVEYSGHRQQRGGKYGGEVDIITMNSSHRGPLTRSASVSHASRPPPKLVYGDRVHSRPVSLRYSGAMDDSYIKADRDHERPRRSQLEDFVRHEVLKHREADVRRRERDISLREMKYDFEPPMTRSPLLESYKMLDKMHRADREHRSIKCSSHRHGSKQPGTLFR